MDHDSDDLSTKSAPKWRDPPRFLYSDDLPIKPAPEFRRPRGFSMDHHKPTHAMSASPVPTDGIPGFDGSGLSSSSPIILDPCDDSHPSSVLEKHIVRDDEVIEEFTEMLRSPVAWIRANPQGSKLREGSYPWEMRKILATLSSPSKDKLINGIIWAGDAQNKINKESLYIHRAKISKVKDRAKIAQAKARAKIAEARAKIAEAKRRIKCKICYEDQIQRVTNCGHAFCSECLFKWMETSMTCPTCRQSVNASYNLFL